MTRNLAWKLWSCKEHTMNIGNMRMCTDQLSFRGIILRLSLCHIYYVMCSELNTAVLYVLEKSYIFITHHWLTEHLLPLQVLFEEPSLVWMVDVTAEAGGWGAGTWRCGGAVGMVSCFPLVNTCLRRQSPGRTWLPLCFPEAREWTAPLLTLSIPEEGLRCALCGEDIGILIDWDWCSRIMLSDGDTLQGDTRSWQPFPLMADTVSADRSAEESDSRSCVL